MTLEVSVADDGTLQYICDGHVVITGPISGHVTCADGTRYNVSPAVIEVAHREHAVEVANLIGARFAAEGHPGHRDGEPFVHVPITLADAVARETAANPEGGVT